MKKHVVASVLLVCIIIPLFSGCLERTPEVMQQPPLVNILHPQNQAKVWYLVMIHGTAFSSNEIHHVEIRINQETWLHAQGTYQWSYEWNAYAVPDGIYLIEVRAWDGVLYSEIDSREVRVENPKTVDSDYHKWVVFIIASNYPTDNQSKLGNGGLYLAEEMSEYFIENLHYPTSNIFILFDDGWIRDDNGYGRRVTTLQQRRHKYGITYGAATKENVVSTLHLITKESNKYRDSEVFLWFFGHGHGDINNTLTGGKTFTSSWFFLWDSTLRDKELGDILGPLKSRKVCIIVDACFSGGFADKTILDFSTLFVLRSGIPRSGRIVISSASKFRPGYASTLYGPIFTLLWFEGLKTGRADGYKSGVRDRGRPSFLPFFKDGKVSVEEAFYYAQYQLRTNPSLSDFSIQNPQMNDQYPFRGVLLSRREMILGEK